MDHLSDTLLEEEILLRLPAKCLHRLRAVSRRYNAIILSPEFAARYWQLHSPYLSGVFFQPTTSECPSTPLLCFLTAYRRPTAFVSMFASDLTFVPGPSAREQAYLDRVGSSSGLFIVNSSAGLLLCSRGDPSLSPVNYYICNPQTQQWVALPELPQPPAKPQAALLSVTAADDVGHGGATVVVARFQVVLLEKRRFWEGPDLHMDLEVFSSDGGEWTALRLAYQPLGVQAYAAPFLGRSGAAYWFGCLPADRVIMYSSVDHSLRVLPVPSRAYNSVVNRCIGERRGGGLRYAHFDVTEFKVWDQQLDGAGAQWAVVHHIGVVEMMERNPETAAFMRARAWLGVEKSMKLNVLFSVLSFHPTDDDIVFLGVPGAVAAYSIQHCTMSFRCICSFHPSAPDQMFPYAHPATHCHVHIPVVKVKTGYGRHLDTNAAP
ncbi:hypothetical protein ACP70R_037702 [Stipagrostis hirtigluma subsp. patula]